MNKLLTPIVVMISILSIANGLIRTRTGLNGRVKWSSSLLRTHMSTKSAGSVKEAIAAKGSEVRELKAANADKSVIMGAVDDLVRLKKELAEIEGVPYEDGSMKSKKKKEKEAKKSKIMLTTMKVFVWMRL